MTNAIKMKLLQTQKILLSVAEKNLMVTNLSMQSGCGGCLSKSHCGPIVCILVLTFMKVTVIIKI